MNTKTIDANSLFSRMDSAISELRAESDAHSDYSILRGFMLARTIAENLVQDTPDWHDILKALEHYKPDDSMCDMDGYTCGCVDQYEKDVAVILAHIQGGKASW